MNKKLVYLIGIVLVLAIAGGVVNRVSTKKAEETENISEPEILATNSPAQANEESQGEIEAQLQAGERIVKDYPDLHIAIDAVCPSDWKAKEMQGLSARLSRTYLDAILQEIYMPEFPDSQEVQEDAWYSYDSNSQFLSSIVISKTGQVAYRVQKRDVNGDPDFHDPGYYAPMDVIALDQAENSGTFTREMAAKQAISLLQPYTDFDLVPVNIYEENGNNGKNWYRMALQMFYKEIPISIASFLPMPSVNNELFYHGTGLDVGYGQNGVGHFQGVFSFDNIVEADIYSVMNLDEILPVFIDQAKILLAGTDGNEAWNIYQIQRELFMEAGEHPGEYIFKPVWAFYFKKEVAGLDNTYSETVKLNAEDGSLIDRSIQ